MNCPNCGHPDHRVLRTDEKNGAVRRTRECLACAKRWHTLEAMEAVYMRAKDIVDAFQHMRGVVGEE